MVQQIVEELPGSPGYFIAKIEDNATAKKTSNGAWGTEVIEEG
uniref:Uncharacterized protein n=1 Tax=Lepeophtheirus salmonis TaxID=72036 RepID=A0A0K2VGY5_LEPSM